MQTHKVYRNRQKHWLNSLKGGFAGVGVILLLVTFMYLWVVLFPDTYVVGLIITIAAAIYLSLKYMKTLRKHSSQFVMDDQEDILWRIMYLAGGGGSYGFTPIGKIARLMKSFKDHKKNMQERDIDQASFDLIDLYKKDPKSIEILRLKDRGITIEPMYHVRWQGETEKDVIVIYQTHNQKTRQFEIPKTYTELVQDLKSQA